MAYIRCHMYIGVSLLGDLDEIDEAVGPLRIACLRLGFLYLVFYGTCFPGILQCAQPPVLINFAISLPEFST